MAGIKFGCGEYAPGGEPISIPSLPVPSTPIIIPEPPVVTIHKPFIPTGGGQGPGGPRPGEPRPRGPGRGTGGPVIGGPTSNPQGPITQGVGNGVKCNSIRIICPQDKAKQPSEQRVLRIVRNCQSCNLNQADPTCIDQTMNQCMQSGCQDTVYTGVTCIDREPELTQIPGQIGPITQGGSVNWWFCETNIEQCVQRSVPSILGVPAGAYATKAACEAQCITRFSGGLSLDPQSNSNTGSTIQPGLSLDPIVNTNSGNPVIPGLSLFPQSNGTTVTEISITINDPVTPQNTLNRSEIYNNSLNFFSTEVPSVVQTPNQSNSEYLNTFNSFVTPSVGNLITAQGASVSWSESLLFDLSLEDIRNSLNTNLLNAFRVIHHPGGQIVGEDSFLKVIQKHLLTGTLSEFDSSYYTSLAERQRNDIRIKYTGLSNKDAAERVGLGTIAAGAILADAESQVNRRKRQIRRQRRLNTDIKAGIPVVPLDGCEKTLYLLDSGIRTIKTDQSIVAVPTGDGDGYYIQIDLSQGDCTPLVTISDYTNTYYVPPAVRYNALTLFRESPSITLSASSLSGSHELIEGDIGPSELVPIYMPLDLASMTYNTTNNPLVAKYSGVYRTETDQELIDEHTTNNGMAITRVNIDYRDPLYRYILDTSAVSLSMNDITFKSIKESVDYKSGIRLSRNIPFGLIITPVAGSRDNPFNGFSTLGAFGDVVTRSLNFMLDINESDEVPAKTQLKEVNLYNEVSGALKIGLVEPADIQNVVHMFEPSSSMYTDTFFDGNSYVSNSTTVSSHGISYLVKDVLDYIINTYNPEGVVWFDILRRMPVNKVGELLYNTNLNLISSIERGYRCELEVFDLLTSINTPTSEILDDDDRVVVKVIDR